MPNIDTSQISGFAEMNTEQKLEALLKFDIPENVDMSKFVSKEIFDRKASEAANYAKQLKEKMTDDEAKKAEDAKALSELKEELETLRKDKTVSEYTARYIALGYDSALAADTAKAMAEGDMARVFANGEKHKEAMEKKIKEDLINRTPKPDGSGGDDGKEKNSAVEKARELAKAKLGDSKSYNDILSKYKK